MSYARNWCFTIYTLSAFTGVFDTDVVARAVWQLELCPNTQREHYQGYIMFKRRLRLSAVKAFLGVDTAHCEVAKGSPGANLVYCTKEDSRADGPFYWPDEQAWADCKGQGKRADLEDMKELIDNGGTIRDVAESHFSQFLKYGNGIRAYMALRAEPRKDRPMEVKFWYGATGTGKTRGVFELFDASEVYVVMRPTNGSLYYDGYYGQTCILFDDFYGWAPISHMLNIMDRYPMMLKIHGGMVPLLNSTTTIIITSNNSLDCLYEAVGNPEVLKAFRRRVSEIKHFIQVK